MAKYIILVDYISCVDIETAEKKRLLHINSWDNIGVISEELGRDKLVVSYELTFDEKNVSEEDIKRAVHEAELSCQLLN